MSENTTTRRKVLVPLATLLVAGGVAVGSGATWSSQSTHSVSVTSGTLSHANSKGGLNLAVTNLKPGDSQSGTLTITNDGTLDSTLSLQETADSSGFTAGAVNLKIQRGSTTVYDGNFGGIDNNTPIDLGALPVNDVATVTYTVSMASDASGANQGKSASASYKYVTTQTSDNSAVKWN